MDMSEHLNIRILKERYNPLIGRRELIFEITGYSGTPPRHLVRKKLSEVMMVDINRVIVKQLLSPYGINITRGRANVYDSAERAKQIEPKHVLDRNALPQEQKAEVSQQ
ncbi:MAG: 30S ribosomal protein S24e [Candidatus Methanomethylicota archaeon]|uniref:Small ribosomal subunit protein eS24 n=1 Tax=Thermoproteota archaeon TaxID=2056631 RepID=A0A497EV35_9CREN|nr:MAG: 30S ribosomal protein S24e [Candidatus Verstraetearchaeota archaeon]RLE53144.1 MAG: 30S ribosomal protein S24e [Candidatus Verstraetearchaeota archaeon]